MALNNSDYRLHVNITYTTTGGATSAASAINAAVASQGRDEVCTVTGAVVDLIIPHITTETEATNLRDAIRSAWSGQTRTGGKAAIARSNAN